MKKRSIKAKGMMIAGGLLCIIIVGFTIYFMKKPKVYMINEPMIKPMEYSVQQTGEFAQEEPLDSDYVEHQVLAVAESKREANRIAREIGGELISYDNQVAIIQIGITVEEMMQKLEEDPLLPKVYPNYQNYTLE